ncbi:MAG: hypothetical protein IIA59_11135 [Candidatus Marinimicrobia bacterium]|nr:hypothetical protein [Candidatus Neomarinimicrobiota bacterium]
MRDQFRHGNDMTHTQINTSAPAASSGQAAQPLLDRFGRKFDYLRLAIIEKCNLRCIYCMPEEGINFAPQSDLLNVEEMTRLIRVIAGADDEKILSLLREAMLGKLEDGWLAQEAVSVNGQGRDRSSMTEIGG